MNPNFYRRTFSDRNGGFGCIRTREISIRRCGDNSNRGVVRCGLRANPAGIIPEIVKLRRLIPSRPAVNQPERLPTSFLMFACFHRLRAELK